eukprot:gene25562-biopygen21001
MGTRGWSSFPTTVSGPTFLKPWRPVGGNVWCVGLKKKLAIPAFWYERGPGRGVIKVEIPTRQPDAMNEVRGVPNQSLGLDYSQRPSVSSGPTWRARAPPTQSQRKNSTVKRPKKNWPTAGCVVGRFYGNLGSPPSQAGDTKRRRPKCRIAYIIREHRPQRTQVAAQKGTMHANITRPAAAASRNSGVPQQRGGGGGAGIPGFPVAHPGAQLRASRRESAPTRRSARARGGGGWDR